MRGGGDATRGEDSGDEDSGGRARGESVARLAQRWLDRAGAAARRAAATLSDAAGGGRETEAAAILWLGPEGVLRATRAARVRLGEAAAPGVPVDALARRIAPGDLRLRAALEALRAEGAPFRRRVASEGRVLELEGRPVGGACALTLRDVTEEARALEAAEAARAAAETELAALRATLDALPHPIWRLGRDGETLWTNAAAGGAPAPKPDAATRMPAPEGDGVVVTAAPTAGGEAADALRRFVGTVSEAFTHLRVGLAIFDAQRRLLLANPAVSKIFNAEPGWLAGRPTLREMLDRLREARLLPEQADYPAWRAAIFTLFDDPARASYEDIWELPDGRGIHVIGRPHPAGGIAFMFEDYTESMALQRWRSTSLEVRRATLDLLDEGVVVFGPDGRVRIANPAFRRQWEFETEQEPVHVSEMAERCRSRLAPGASDHSDVWGRVRAAVASGGVRAPWSERTPLEDGRVLLGRIAPLPDGSTLAAFSDVTDAERVSAALAERAAAHEAAEEMRTALVDQISHRLRTPLNAILGFADLLRSGRAGELEDRQRDYVETIHDASVRLLEGVESLSDLASLHGGELSLSRRDVELAPALRGAAEVLRGRAAEKAVSIRLALVAPDATAHGDPARFRQMIFNLLVDALAAAKPGARLEARLERRGGSVAFLCDRPPEPVAPGLAFALARRVAELHGGGVSLVEEDGRPVSLCRLPAGEPAGGEASPAATERGRAAED